MEETNDARTEIPGECFDFPHLFLTEENDFTVTLGTSEQSNINISNDHSITHDSEVMNDARTEILGEDFDFLDLPFKKDYDFSVTSETSEQNEINVSTDKPIIHDSEVMNDARTEILGEDFDFLDLPFEKDYDFSVTSETSEHNKINALSDQPITHDTEVMNDARTKISGENFDFIDLPSAKENDFTATSETSEKNRKIKVSTDEPIMHDSKGHKRSRTEICEMSNQVTLPFTEQGGVNRDLEASAKTSQTPWYSNCLIVVTIESPNLRVSHLQKKSLQKHENLDGVRKSTIVQTTQSNTISSQNEKSPNKVSVSEKSKEKNSFPSEDILAFPRPPCSRSRLENMPRLIEQTVEEIKKTSVCLVCEHKISQHFKEEEENPYKCCKCKYRIGDQDLLLMHICRAHLSEPFFCKTCKVRYAKIGLHESDIQCNACKENFRCINQLEDHYYSHESHHKETCRMCQTDIDKHRMKLKTGVFYKCCCKKCGDTFKQKHKFRKHLYSHSDMNIFKCEYCGERFNLKGGLEQHLKTHPNCEICKKKFLDKNSLDSHIFREH